MTIIVFIVFWRVLLESLGQSPFCLVLRPISHQGFPLEAPRPGEQEKACSKWS